MPLPMKSAAKRFGNAGSVPRGAISSPQTGSDSSQGKPIATPTPRSIVRREIRELIFTGSASGTGGEPLLQQFRRFPAAPACQDSLNSDVLVNIGPFHRIAVAE